MVLHYSAFTYLKCERPLEQKSTFVLMDTGENQSDRQQAAITNPEKPAKVQNAVEGSDWLGKKQRLETLSTDGEELLRADRRTGEAGGFMCVGLEEGNRLMDS